MKFVFVLFALTVIAAVNGASDADWEAYKVLVLLYHHFRFPFKLIETKVIFGYCRNYMEKITNKNPSAVKAKKHCAKINF